jgi:DNA helicase-2/ATP-dependent DNA helicase PcrA
MDDKDFSLRYNKLNDEQKRATDYIDGPLLVLAGPGTGKTELLSVRTANIMAKTDTLAQNILCLTFTDAASLNMQNRLRSIIGDQAYDVQINTYHSFAGEIISSYPEYFRTTNTESGEDYRLERPIDEIRQVEIIAQIAESLPFDNPLRGGYYVDNIRSIISDLKQANINPQNLKEIATKNIECINLVNSTLIDDFSDFKSMPRKSEDAIKLFGDFFQKINSIDRELSKFASVSLREALDEATEQSSTKPLTIWKNDWLKKDAEGNWLFTDIEQNRKLIYLSDIFTEYQAILEKESEYDFNDMILRSIDAIKTYPELKNNLQERYQYILLDEFQDTNAAQFELIRLIADHPVNEGRPNIMAVGDDDQGIFAFQGADINNMISFLETFVDVEVINLVKNYRSHHQILHIAHKIADQIENRLHHNMKGVTKEIISASESLPEKAEIARHEFKSESAELGWISEEIEKLINKGVEPNEISVIAPKHKILESAVPFLNQKSIPVTYEKRENIIETEIVSSIYYTALLLIAIQQQDFSKIDELMPLVLSYDFWKIKPLEIWKTNWEFSKAKYDDYSPWPTIALNNNDLSKHVMFLLELGLKSKEMPLEIALDYIIGVKSLGSENSPMYNYYFSEKAKENKSQEFYESLSHLSVIRSHLRDLQRNADNQILLSDFVLFIDSYKKTGKSLINSHPIVQNENAIQLQTVYKSKGLEYKYVFLPSMSDDIWGKSSRSNSSKISLPENLKHIKHLSDTEDTKRRLLFVAVTRAKCGLYMTSYLQKENGKSTLPAKYLLETEADGTKKSEILPTDYNKITLIDRAENTSWNDVKTLWFSTQNIIQPNLKYLLNERLKYYVMSPTHLNSFTNLEYSSPQDFLMNTILRFPQAPTSSSIYGDAIHKALEFYQNYHKDKDSKTEAIKIFSKKIKTSYVDDNEKDNLTERGLLALENYIKNRGDWLKQPGQTEVDFRKEGVTLGDAKLTGKIDRLEIDTQNKISKVYDFKTGKPINKWSADSKVIGYKQQLYFYRYLIEHSNRFKNYSVEYCGLEFVEIMGDTSSSLGLEFNEQEYDNFKKLVTVTWNKIINLDMPDISSYERSASGTKRFIADLVDNKI